MHACHAKCAGARTLTAECVGYILGADPDDTEVLCADEEMCQSVARELGKSASNSMLFLDQITVQMIDSLPLLWLVFR